MPSVDYVYDILFNSGEISVPGVLNSLVGVLLTMTFHQIVAAYFIDILIMLYNFRPVLWMFRHVPLWRL